MPGIPRLRRIFGTAALAREFAGQARFAFRPLPAIRHAQSRRIRAMVEHAWRTVPFWREAMRERGLAPRDFRGEADLARLPVVERSDLQRDPDRFRSTAFRDADLLALRSGGSTGEPITVRHDTGSLLANAAHGERERSIWAGSRVPRFGYREAVVVPPFNAAIEVQRFCRERAWLPARADIDRRYLSMLDPIDEVIAALDDFRPHIVHSYGSFLEALFARVEATGAPFHRPALVTYSSDGMSESARARIAGGFGVPVFCTYQAVEMFKIGFECEAHDGVHVNIDLYPLRLDADGTVIVSNLVNRATVLLNYRLADVVAPIDARCPCGRTLPRITRPQGRSVEFLPAPDGGVVHPQAIRTIFTAERGVWQYQVDQIEPARFVVRVVAAADCDRAAAARRIGEGFAHWFGSGAAVDVRYVDALERTAGGKLRPIRALSPAPPTP